jgi:glycosyltransferase involved in cell wall biosynthesis
VGFFPDEVDRNMLTVVSRLFPPQVGGSSILLSNVLSSYKGDLTAVVGYDQYCASDSNFKPPCPTHYLAFPRLVGRSYNRIKKRLPQITYRVLEASIRKALKELNSSAVIGVYPFDDYFVASFLAARRLGLPFYAHMHDLWEENIPPGRLHRFAKQWEAVILKDATRVLCITEHMQDYYHAKYVIKSDLLPHTVPDMEFRLAPSEMCRVGEKKPTVLFVGSVSPQMNLDALKVLAAASELLPQDYELLFCTPGDISSLGNVGIRSNRLQVKYVSRAEVQQLQSEAHVLIAPLSHKDCSVHEVRTVFSTKLLEYFVAGRPILVFAPEDSYHAKSARKNGWGYVVDEDSPLALAAGIMKVITDVQLSSGLVKSALREARSRSSDRHAARLLEWVRGDERQNAAGANSNIQAVAYEKL